MKKVRVEIIDFFGFPDKFYPSLYQKAYGELVGSSYRLDLFEVAYLLDKGKAEVFLDGRKIYLKDLMEIGKKFTNMFPIKYVVYKDLRDKGLFPKAAFKYGADFRVYDKEPGEKRGMDRVHSKYLVKVFYEEDRINFIDFASFVRIANSVRKTLLIAVVDKDWSVTYYEVRWVKNP